MAALVAFALVADFVAVTFVAFVLVADFVAVTFGARAFVAVIFVALAFVAVTLVALAFVVAILAAALVGAAFFGVTPLLAPEVAFFTAMLGPFKMALDRPHESRTLCA